MKVTFVSNYFNHHQRPFSEAMAQRCDYTFVETEEMDAERKGMGWEMQSLPDYVRPSAKAEDAATSCRIHDSELVILGSAPDRLMERRLKAGKLTFKYAERFYKEAPPQTRALRNRLAAWLHHGRFQKYPLHMLCASAYTAADCAWSGNYKGRCYKWGYFPEARRYDTDALMAGKRGGPVSILWVARMMDLKHPEAAVLTAERLKQAGYDFEMTLIGSGELEEAVRESLRNKGLEDCVHLTGSLKPEQVREHMERSEIFLFTSDRNEGWGAVLNESMNSGCAVAASHAIGSVPFLMKHEENGLIFKSEDWDDLYTQVKRLMDDPALRERLGRAACRTITEAWNAEAAAERVLRLAEALKAGEDTPFAEGPCSKAEILQDDWM